MKLRAAAITLMILLLGISGHAGVVDRLTLLTPPPVSSVATQRLTVVVRVQKNIFDTIEISAGEQKKAIPPSAGMDVVHLAGIELARGMNTIRVAGFSRGRLVEEKELQVFFRSDLSPDSTPPAGFDPYLFHVPERDRACSLCHQVNFEGIAETPESPKKSPCYGCHRKVIERKYVHGPAAVWSCSVCHNTGGKGQKNGLVKPDEKACAACHSDSVNAWKEMPYGHGPTAMGNCVTCHNPHGSDQPFFLHVQATDLCLSCHVDVASRPHVISSPSGKGGHPTRMSPDPFHPERDFACSSCHNPHAGKSPIFLNNYKGSISGFCMSCHSF